jgi:hypothetical protein
MMEPVHSTASITSKVEITITHKGQKWKGKKGLVAMLDETWSHSQARE